MRVFVWVGFFLFCGWVGGWECLYSFFGKCLLWCGGEGVGFGVKGGNGFS